MTYRTFDGTSQTETITDGRFSSDGTQYIADLEKINIGTGKDLKIYHDTNHTFIEDAGVGDLYISSNKVRIRNAGVNQDMIIAEDGGPVSLYGYGSSSPKLATASDGVHITGKALLGHTSSISTSGYNPSIQVVGATADTSSIAVGRFSNDASASSIHITKSRSISGLGSHTNGELHNDDVVGNIFWWGSDGGDYEEVARIGAEAGGAFTGSSTPGELTFWTTAVDATTATERLRIGSDGKATFAGNILVGVTGDSSSASIKITKTTTEVLADNEPLYDNPSPAFLTIYNPDNTGSGEEAGINIIPAGNNNGAISIYGKKTASYAGDLIFRFRTGASTSAERLRINSAGNVGIGTANPVQLLNVHSGSSSGALLVQSDSATNYFAAVQSADDYVSGAAVGSLAIRSAGGIYFSANGGTKHLDIASTGVATFAGNISSSGSVDVSGQYKVASHPVVGYASTLSSYATRLGSTGTSTLRYTQIYGGGNLIATCDGVDKTASFVGDITSNNIAGNNLVINGAMQVAQRGTQADMSTGYSIDRWKVHSTGTAARATVSQDTEVPSGQGFAKSMKLDCTTADGSPGSGDYYALYHLIEGQNLQHLKYGTSSAEKCTLSFWVRSPKTGIHTFEVESADGGKFNSTQYTIASADTWQKVEITFDGYQTTAIANDNTVGLYLTWWLQAGSAFTGGSYSANTWHSTNANRAVGQVNVLDSASNDFYITGVQLEIGSVATPFEHKTYADDLRECQRYYYKMVEGNGDGHTNGAYISQGSYYQAALFSTVFSFPTTMRSTPTLDYTSGTDYYKIFTNNTEDNADSFALTRAHPNGGGLDVTGSVSGTQGHGGSFSTKHSSAKIAFVSEL